MADRLASVPSMQGSSPVFAIAQVEDSPRNEAVVTLASLHQQLSKLATSNETISAKVAELKKASSSSRRSRAGSSSEANGRRSRMYRGLNQDGSCLYHLVLGANATKCSDGCRQAGNGRAGR